MALSTVEAYVHYVCNTMTSEGTNLIYVVADKNIGQNMGLLNKVLSTRQITSI